MKGRPVDQLVYECMFPKPRTNDPQNFHTLLHRNLIPEVRQEVNLFYGHLETQEAKYPGLDYCHRVHRIRLGRYQWHRRLFRAFDALRLTDSEIANLTKWEGTKWAKERFERDSGIVIRDTAFDEIGDWVEPEDRPQIDREATREEPDFGDDVTATPDEEMEGEEEDSDGELTSVGVPLNERLRERAARHEAGDTSLPLDEEWEQWLKNAIESGELPFLTEQYVRRSNNSLMPQAVFPPRTLSMARAGRWDEIPDFLHPIVRYALDNEALSRTEESLSPTPAPVPTAAQTAAQTAATAPPQRASDDLRLPPSDPPSNTGRLQRTAQPGA
ncbi:hypothetical protein F4819DRAFT_500082 [Hypoxylon fuscum]|nr:hypothetical protein F4819DRAFT_500082 [Hypoxylon fuscum]